MRKILQFFSIILLSTLLISMHAMDQSKKRKREKEVLSTPSKRVKIVKIKEREPDMRLIQVLPEKEMLQIIPKVPEGAGIITSLQQGSVAEYLNIDIEEPVQAATFKELIEEKQKKGYPFILAVVSMKGPDNKIFHSYYEATGLNFFLFDYSKINRGQYLHKVLQKKDPILRRDIQGIQYFSLDKLDQKKFRFIGTEENLFGDKQYMLEPFFIAHQDNNPIARAYAQVRWALFDAKKTSCSNAISLLKRVINQNSAPLATILAQYELARLYIDLDIEGAEPLFIALSQQNLAPFIRAYSRYKLGVLHGDRNAIQKAFKELLVIAQQEDETQDVIQARWKVARVYLKQRDLDSSFRWLKMLDKDSVLLSIRNEAQYLLAQILFIKNNNRDSRLLLEKLESKNLNNILKADVLFLLARLDFEEKNYQKTIKDLLGALSLGLPKSIEAIAFLILGKAYKNITNVDEALKWLSKAAAQGVNKEVKLQAQKELADVFFTKK